MATYNAAVCGALAGGAMHVEADGAGVELAKRMHGDWPDPVAGLEREPATDRGDVQTERAGVVWRKSQDGCAVASAGPLKLRLGRNGPWAIWIGDGVEELVVTAGLEGGRAAAERALAELTDELCAAQGGRFVKGGG